MGRGAGIDGEAGSGAHPRWPRLRRLPEPAQVAELAWQMRNAIAHRGDRFDGLEALCEIAGCRLRVDELRATHGGLQGLLLPRQPGRFELIVDDAIPGGGADLMVKLREDVRRHRRRFLIAHELAHTFFFAWNGPKAHSVEPKGEALEAFCDEFARALLVPPRLVAQVEPSVESLIRIQRRFDVSMEVAARALDASHGERVFVALLLRVADHPDLTRPQWRSAGPSPSGRWWTGDLVDEAIRSRRCQAELSWRRGTAAAEARHLPARRQVLLVAERP